MSTENERALDAFIKQLTKEIPLEEPNDQFTDTVLSTIEATIKQRVRIVHTPVFSKTSWVVIGLIAIALLIIGYLSGEQGTALPNFFSFLTEASNTKIALSLPTIANSKILLFSSLAFICCVAIQILWLKKSWAKKHVLF